MKKIKPVYPEIVNEMKDSDVNVKSFLESLSYQKPTVMRLNLAKIIFKSVFDKMEGFKLISQSKGHYIVVPDWIVSNIPSMIDGHGFIQHYFVQPRKLSCGQTVYAFNILNGNMWRFLIQHLDNLKAHNKNKAFCFINNHDLLSNKSITKLDVGIQLPNGCELILHGESLIDTKNINGIEVCEHWFDFTYLID